MNTPPGSRCACLWAIVGSLTVTGCTSATQVYYADQRVWADGTWHELDTAVVLKQTPQLIYPAEAVRTGKTGIVLFLVEVDTVGRAHSPDITIADDEAFISPILAASQDLVFSIPTHDRKPISMKLGLAGKFEIVSDSSGRREPHAHFVMQTQREWEELRIAAPGIVHTAAPEYPAIALEQRVEGRVWVRVWVGPEGIPLNVSVLKSDKSLLNDAAVDAARRSRFRPAMHAGKPVWASVCIPFRFVAN